MSWHKEKNDQNPGREKERRRVGRKRPPERDDVQESPEVTNQHKALPHPPPLPPPVTVDADSSCGVETYTCDGKDSARGVRAKDAQASQLLMSDPIYRIMHALPRSDVLEVVKCQFSSKECERAATYFDSSFMKKPLRHLRLQIGCDRATGLHLFFPRLHHHRGTLRLLDLSRNDLDEDDVATLTQLLDLRSNTPSGGAASSLEVLDLSYNRRVGNRGALFLLHSLRCNNTIRAVILKGISLDDSGAIDIAPLLCQRPRPRVPDDRESVTFQETTSRRLPTFFLNLNENRIGAAGTVALGKGIPVHVSLTLCKQRPMCDAKRPTT
ncbi:hypothetical protein DQ04_01131120 [Trypanosoma grayi]|uniref:hypothetical protein n=1 Tax=Trypanosoma grayi TaxID=71804 RepID=UPI0004F43EAE|nr:hypothetical protein DQ04_01131120 [Trypanosoma grayi]KEG13243.1 hypothetical protein DQ04_01131120 [Trypanosoma grayi]